jgi:predicted DNA-binding protein (UPF0251 family)
MWKLETERLRLDELEALRLCDLEGLSQEEAGGRMGVSRGTVQRLVKSGRAKVVRALVRNAALEIGDGESGESGDGESGERGDGESGESESGERGEAGAATNDGTERPSHEDLHTHRG